MMISFLKKFFEQDPVFYGRRKISELIEKFVNDDSSLDDSAWDDFMNAHLGDSYERLIQRLACLIESYFPADNRNEWCNAEGGKALVRIAEAIRSDSLPFPPTECEIMELDKHQIPMMYKNIILYN